MPGSDKWHLALLVLLGCCFSCSLAASGGEISALTDLYYACGGDAWLNNTHWLQGDPCTNGWYGVVCESGHVSGLYLQSNRLVGQITSTLDSLYALDTLALYDNDISGSIPTGWSYLRSLVKLDIHENKFHGAIPDVLGSLLEYNLEYLDLSDNLLEGSVPTFFNGAQSEFSYVDLSGNQFICPIPSWAQYTHATCLECGLISVQPYCTGFIDPVILFGYNFNALSAVNCTMVEPDSGAWLADTSAIILSDNMIQCQVYFPFSNCSGTPGDRLYEMVALYLSLDGQILTNGSVVEMGVLNPYCAAGSIAGWTIPNPSVTEEICTFTGNPTPWQCPAQASRGSSFYNAVFNPDCTNNSTVTCLWAPYYEPNYHHTCPYYQCQSSHVCALVHSSSCPTSYTTGNCFVSLEDCSAQCH